MQSPRSEKLRLMQRPNLAARSVELDVVEDAVDRAPGRLVGTFHRREVGVGAYVVRGQKKIRNRCGRLRPQSPGVLQIHEQRLDVMQKIGTRLALSDVGVEKPGMEILVEQ